MSHILEPTVSDRIGKQRLSTTFLVLLSAFAIALTLSLPLGASVTSFCLGLAFLLFALLSYRFFDDKLVYAVVTHPTWVFGFSAFIYAALHGRAVDYGLNDPALSMSIVLGYQFAVLAGYLVAKGVYTVVFPEVPHRHYTRSTRTLVVLFLIGVAITMLPVFAGRAGFVFALSAVGLVFFWSASALLLQQPGMGRRLVVVVVVTLGLTMSFALNQRAWTLTSVLFVLLYVTFYVKPALTMRNLLIAVVATASVSVFSEASLRVRQQGAQESPLASVMLYATTITSPDTLQAGLGLGASGGASPQPKNDTAFHSAFYEGRAGLLERLTLLPVLDIVSRHLGWSPALRPAEITNLVLASLPDVGQPKDLILSDRLVWEFGLRRVAVLGRPQISAAAEFFSMGGFLVFATLVPVIFSIIFFQLFVLRRISGSYATFCFLAAFSVIYVIFSSTALSVTTVALRALPIMLLIVLLSRQSARDRFTPLQLPNLAPRSSPRP